ncbi:hypothetical protein PHYSODRAFT_248508 [Phytophthora sojae]|uniref:Uncharacterized protein n=1 Tax=Phytophthora sojae (strain P6497) TaxID=1094619 RepID=G4YIJ3_PHYSP|nr:hypothetical protein PHYSODRAFT_248508 [Phytophthora sojae]EGZ28117.1 hypothetical protein PHYSODRAFT_248508 [Phytophthora sojae]|eukprot:XP_009515392.1 hypothetical protein PHYSODRAFT_248508 [Phytophthora sojae]
MASPSTTSVLNIAATSVPTPAGTCSLSATSSGTSMTMVPVTTGLAASTAVYAALNDAAVLMLRPAPSVPSISALQTASTTTQSAPVTSTISGLLQAVEASPYRTEPGQPVRSRTPRAVAEIQKLQEDLERANKLGAQFAAEKLDADDAVSEAALKITSLECELTGAQKRIAELEAQILDSRAFDPGALYDFFVNSSAFKGNWRRFLELLQLYRTGKLVPTGYRTTIQVSARDLEFEDSDPYMAQAAQPSAASAPASSSSGSAQATTTTTRSSLSATPLHTPLMLSLDRSTSAGSSKIRRKALKSLPLTKALDPSSSKKSGGLKIQTSAPSSSAALETVDLARSASSTPKVKTPMIKPFTQQIAVPRRPTKFKPERKNAKKESPSARSDLDAAKAVPNQFSWDGTRPDVQELMLVGVAF